MNSLKIYTFLFIFILCFKILLMPSNFKNMHPLILGLIMLLYSILISLNFNMFNKSSIYSMMMFLIIVGGFLILFLYFNSFAINNKMIFNNFMIMFLYKILLIYMFMSIMIYKNNLFNMILFLNMKLLEMLPIWNLNFNNNESNINMIYLKFYYLTLFLMIYLLYTLIIIVKIIFYLNPKSIRQLINN